MDNKITHPAVSVLMSVYNEPLEWIKQAIDSILTQTFSDFEFIIINDNPHSNALQTELDNYASKDLRILLITNSENIGLAASLNKGIDIAKGKYIARMDADDISMPKRFAYQYEYMEEHPDIDICGTWAKFFGNISFLSCKEYKMPISPNEAKIQAVFSSPLIHPSIFAKCELMKEYHYDSSLRKAQDFDLWTRIICKGGIITSLPIYLLQYRVTKKSQNPVVISKQEAIAELCRKRNLHNIGFQADSEEKDLHIRICRFDYTLDIESIESWLQRLRIFLVEKYPQEKDYIIDAIGQYWSISCLRLGTSIKYYYTSSLHRGLKWIDILRFLKRFLKKYH